MAENKNIQIQDVLGNNLFPKTLGSIVFNNAGKNLGGVEENAQVNKLEKVKVNGTELAITDKAVDISMAAYSIAKAETAESGFLATYNLTKDGAAVGASINIPKDFLVKSGTVKTVTEADQPVAGYKVGDKYIDFVINSKDASATDEHMYILVSDLIDVYTEGNGIKITGHSIAIDDAVVVNHTEFDTELAKKVDKLATKPTAGTYTKVTINAEGQVTAGATLTEEDIPALHLAKVTDVTATAAEVNVLDGIEASTAELNYVKGVTSGIQGQIDAKVAKNADITAGTACKITYDAKGLVTAGAALTQDDIPALNLTKVTDVTATAAELNALAGAGAVKADFEKLHAVTATAAEINKLAGLATTATELGYVAGVTSAIQTQLDAKLTYVELS